MSSNQLSPAFLPGIFDPHWTQTYGSENDDEGWSVIECSGGGFAIAGYTFNTSSGSNDFWLIRTDAAGNHLWNHTYGGPGNDQAFSVIECTSGGFALVGTTNYGDQTGNMTLIRTDISGTYLWNKTFNVHNGGDPEFTRGWQVDEDITGNFTILGWASIGGPWLVQTDSDGNHLWNQTYGGGWGILHQPIYERLSMARCSDFGFALIGTTKNPDANYWTDVRLLRVDYVGALLWEKTYNKLNYDAGRAIIEMTNGEFTIVASSTDGAYDLRLWLLRTDASGNLLWDRVFGGYFPIIGHVGVDGWDISTTTNGGLIIVGKITYEDGPTADYDVGLIRVNATGYHLWNQTYGGIGTDTGYAFVETSDGDFVITGITDSFGAGGIDVYLLRIPDPPIFWREDPQDQFAELGADFHYDLNAFAWVGVDSWWVNDTTRFSITNQGIISNASTLSIGSFGLQVGVNDTLGNELTTEFTVNVVDRISPTWVQPLSNQTVELGASFSYDVDARDLSGIDQWWVNDTTHFSISAEGVITNKVALLVKNYGVLVAVNDTYNNELNGSFTVTVQDTTPPTWVTAPSDQVLLYGQLFDYQINATDLSGIADWSLNNTSNFDITNGRITSYGILPVGTYPLTVTVTDNYGNSRSATFTVTIQQPQIPGFPAAAVAFGVISALGTLIVFRRQKRIKSNADSQKLK